MLNLIAKAKLTASVVLDKGSVGVGREPLSPACDKAILGHVTLRGTRGPGA